MKTKLIACMVFGVMIDTCAMAAVPNTFSAGEPARAADVNANFADLDSRVSANATNISNIPVASVYDYTKFVTASNVTSKTFNVSPDGDFCPSTSQEIRTYGRTQNGADTNVTITEKWQDNNGICIWRTYNYLNTPTQKQFLSAQYFDATGVLVSTENMDVPMVLATSTMVKGAMYGGASILYSTPVGQPQVLDGDFIENRAVLGIEDVTVPAGSFTGCLKTMVNRTSSRFGQFNRITWSCPGMGEVKRIQYGGVGPRIWVLSSYTTSP